MKKLLLCTAVSATLVLAAASPAQAQILADDFSTGFDGRDPGDPLVGFAVQTGSGTWSNSFTGGPGTLSGSTRFLTGGGVTETVGQGGGVYLPWTQPTLGVFSMSVDMTPNDFGTAGEFTIGFAEVVDSGFWRNNTTGDSLFMRYIHSGPNKGRFQFLVTDESTSNNLFSSSAAASPDNTDTIRLTLSYDNATGAITGSAFNVTDNVLVSSGTHTDAGLTGMNQVGFGWSSIPNQTTSPATTPGVVGDFSVVPEPSTAAMLLLGALGLLARRRR